MLEHVNQEIKRRIRVARLFPNETFLLRLDTALLAKISEEWESGKIYLDMERQPSPQFDAQRIYRRKCAPPKVGSNPTARRGNWQCNGAKAISLSL